jgi:hypothetical protein
MIFTKEKLVAAIAIVVSVSGVLGVRRPVAGHAIEIPPEEAARPTPVSAVPPLKPEHAWDGNGRDPFVQASAWVDPQPAALPAPPPISLGRAWPAPTLPGGPRAPHLVLKTEPKPLADEPDPAPAPGEEGGK